MQSWKKVFKNVTDKSYICEHHFKPDDLLKEFDVIKLQDGTTFSMSKETCRLKKGAVPVSVSHDLKSMSFIFSWNPWVNIDNKL